MKKQVKKFNKIIFLSLNIFISVNKLSESFEKYPVILRNFVQKIHELIIIISLLKQKYTYNFIE